MYLYIHECYTIQHTCIDNIYKRRTSIATTHPQTPSLFSTSEVGHLSTDICVYVHLYIHECYTIQHTCIDNIYKGGAPQLRRRITRRDSSPRQRWVISQQIYVYMNICIYINVIRTSIRVYIIYKGGALNVSVDDGPFLRVKVVQPGQSVAAGGGHGHIYVYTYIVIYMNGIRSSILAYIIYEGGAHRLRRRIRKRRASSPLQRWVISQQIYICVYVYLYIHQCYTIQHRCIYDIYKGGAPRLRRRICKRRASSPLQRVNPTLQRWVISQYIYVYLYIFIYMNVVRSGILVYIIYKGGALDVSVDDGPLLRVKIVQPGQSVAAGDGHNNTYVYMYICIYMHVTRSSILAHM